MSGNTPAPGTPQTGTKATIAAVLAFVSGFLTTLVSDWTGDGPVTAHTLVVAIIGGLVALGVTGVATYNIPNKPK